MYSIRTRINSSILPPLTKAKILPFKIFLQRGCTCRRGSTITKPNWTSFLLPEIYIGFIKRFSAESDLSFSLFLSRSITNSAIPPSNLYSNFFIFSSLLSSRIILILLFKYANSLILFLKILMSNTVVVNIFLRVKKLLKFHLFFLNLLFVLKIL